MQTQVADLTARYTQTLNDALAAVEPLSEDGLRRSYPADQGSVVALACHIANVHRNAAGWIGMVLAGDPLPPITMADIDRMNAEQARSNAGLSKDEVLARLQAGGAAMASVLQGLRDDDLARSQPFTLIGGEFSVQNFVEYAVINHTREHLASLQAATGSPAPASE